MNALHTDFSHSVFFFKAFLPFTRAHDGKLYESSFNEPDNINLSFEYGLFFVFHSG